MKPKWVRCLYPAILAVGVGSVSATCALSATIFVDEQGHILIDGIAGPPGVLAPDPDTGAQVLVYSLPFPGNPGQVVLTDPNSSVSDIIRFPGNSTLEYFSETKQQTTLSAAAAFGATNIKVNSTTGYKVGDQIDIDTGAAVEKATIAAVGTSGASGTGITLAAPLTSAHAAGSGVTEPLELADTSPLAPLDDPFPAGDPTISLAEVAGGTLWSPGTSGIGGDSTSPEYDFAGATTPLPGTLPLFAGGLSALGILGWRRKKKAALAA